MQHRGVMHFHSGCSYDCVTSVTRIADILEAERFTFAILTDHDTVEGSVALRAELERRGSSIQVPVAAEYNTDCGDVIAAFIQGEIQARGFDALAEEVHRQGGLLLLPHPYHHHKQLEHLAAGCDLIEVFNPRVTDDQNNSAGALATRHGKGVYFGADAHFAHNITDTIVRFEGDPDLRRALGSAPIHCERATKSLWAELMASQYIKAGKRRNRSLAINLSRKLVRQGVFGRKLLTRI